jgi:DNA-binding transcriptional regulator LsrR (DeoR family)
VTDHRNNFALMRQVHAVLVMHYIDGLKQSEIAAALNLSPSKVNRLIALGKRNDLVRIDIRTPFQRLNELEQQLIRNTGLSSAVVAPATPGSESATLRQVGQTAASDLTETLRDGDVIAITGGKAVSAVVEGLAAERTFDVTVVPLTGGVQGKYYTDVNHLATRMAERLGGRTMLLHAPLFAECREQRDMLKSVASIREVLDLARRATVAVVGIGSIKPPDSSYYDLHPIPADDRHMLAHTDAAGELLGYIIRADGSLANYALNSRLVALELDELKHCKRVIGVASGQHKVGPIRAALSGGYLDALVSDEATVGQVLETWEGGRHVA